jgi:photosystem I subunit XI
MANFIKPYNDDPFVGHLATPITSSSITRAILKNLPAYRFGLTPLLRGLEIGLAHGYFLIGPFVKLGPLRNSDVALFAGFLSTIGLIIILTLGLTIYGAAVFQNQKSVMSNEESTLTTKVKETLGVEASTTAKNILGSSNINDLQTKEAWAKFKGGFFVGACGSAGFAFICLSSVPLFNIY